MSRTGDFSTYYFIYLSWPGSLVVPALASKIFQVNFEPLIPYAPFIMQVLYSVPLYIVLRNTLGKQHKNYCWVGLWIFYLANWIGSAYFGSAPGLGLLLLLVLMALATTLTTTSYPSQWKSRKSLILIGSILVVYGCLTTVHSIMSGLALLTLPILLLLKNNKKVAISIFGICMVLIVTWGATGASRYTTYIITGRQSIPSYDSTDEVLLFTEDYEIPDPPIEGIWGGLEVPERFKLSGPNLTLTPSEIAKAQIEPALRGNESHIAVVKVRLIYSGLFVVLGLVGITTALLKKGSRKSSILMLAVILVTLACIVQPFGGGMWERVYLGLLMPLSYFSARLWAEHKNRLITIGLCILLITCMPLHLIAHYGNQRIDYYSPEQLEGIRYFQENMPKGSIVGLDQLWVWKNAELYYQNSFSTLAWDESKIVEIYTINPVSTHILSRITPPDPLYFPVTRHDRDNYDYLYNNLLFVNQVESLLINSESCTLIYDTPDFRLYSVEIEDRI